MKKHILLVALLLILSFMLSACQFQHTYTISAKNRILTLPSLEGLIAKEMFKNRYFLTTRSNVKLGLLDYYLSFVGGNFVEVRMTISQIGDNSYQIYVDANDSWYVSEDSDENFAKIKSSIENISNIVSSETWEEMSFDNPDFKMQIN
jgi:hypothetical protein